MSKDKVRVTMHLARAAATSKHNDRNFDVEKSDHIHSERSGNNIYWTYDEGLSPNKSFEESELEYYERTFGSGLDARNGRYKKEGHSERVRTMQEYHKAIHSRPEEVIWMIGDKNTDITAGELWDIITGEVEWKKEQFPQVVTLNLALHADEEGGIHVHERFVWVGHDKDGNEIVGQSKALQEMGIERPNMSSLENRYNNAKTSFSRLCREHFIRTCEEHGLDINREPRAASKSGKQLLQFQVDAMKEEVNELEEKRDRLQEDIEIESESFERVMTSKIKASEIRKRFGDHEVRTYHKSSLEQAENISREAKEALVAANRTYIWAHNNLEEAEKLKRDSEKGVELKKEYEEKLAAVDKIIDEKVEERLTAYIHRLTLSEYTFAMKEFMEQFQSPDGHGSLFDYFDIAYIESKMNEDRTTHRDEINEETEITNDEDVVI